MEPLADVYRRDFGESPEGQELARRIDAQALGLPLKVLRGDRNQCPSCNEYFNSTSAFEKHRVGTIGVDRRCLTSAGMTLKGMSLNKDGFWVTEVMSKNTVSKVRQSA